MKHLLTLMDLTKEEIIEKLDPKEYIGRCPSQVDEFLKDVVSPIIEKYGKEEISEELKV